MPLIESSSARKSSSSGRPASRQRRRRSTWRKLIGSTYGFRKRMEWFLKHRRDLTLPYNLARLRSMEAALSQFGYRLSPQLLNLLQRKYGAVLFLPIVFCSRSLNIEMQGSAPAAAGVYRGAAPPGITFDRFVRACVVVKQITESFAALDTDRDGWVQINYDKFLQTVLTLP